MDYIRLCARVYVLNVLVEVQRAPSDKALIHCHSHLVSRQQITESSQVSLRVETCSGVTYGEGNGTDLPTSCTPTHKDAAAFRFFSFVCCLAGV